jgi:hypothetical protein
MKTMFDATSKCTRDESGTVAIVFAVLLFVIVAVTGLAITAGDAYSIRNKTQLALDAAVVGAASASYELSDADRIALAHKLYESDRTLRAEGRPEIAVLPASNARFTISNTVVYGFVDFNLTTPFLSLFGEQSLRTNVTSAARRRIGAPVCVLGLDATEEATMDLNGKAVLQVDNCATQANSSNGQGMRQVGTSNMKAKQIGVTGGYAGENYNPPPIAGTVPVVDPYASLPNPTIGACHPMSGAKLIQKTLTLTPGTYCGGLDIKASSVITLAPGIYIFRNGPLTVDAQSTVVGTEVMLSFMGPTSTLYLYSGSTLDVTSPTSGAYKNIQFFGDRTAYPGPGSNGANGPNLWFTVIGDSRLTYDGALYTPAFHVWFAGGSIVEGKSPSYLAIAKKLWFQDNTSVHLAQVNSRGINVEASVQLEYGAALYK